MTLCLCSGSMHPHCPICSQVGVFEMLQTGLVAVPSPSHAFLSSHHDGSEAASTAASSSRAAKGVRGGAAVAVTMQGSRPLLLEVQVNKLSGSERCCLRACL